MKRFLFISSLLLLSIPLIAQNYFPFPDSDAVWTDANISTGQYVDSYKYGVAGDTMINSTWYKKVYESTDSVFNVQNASYYAAFRDSNKKWYTIPKLTANEHLLYDFDVILGDSIVIDDPWSGVYDVRIDKVDSILINGQYRKQYHAQLLPGYDNAVIWIEGIGSVKGIIYPVFPFICHDSKLLCFEESDTIKYMDSPNNECYYIEVGIEESINESEFHIYPNPTTSTITIRGNYKLPVVVDLYDITGKHGLPTTVNRHSGMA